MACRQTACRHCDADIENCSPYRKGEWRDRGGNTHCVDSDSPVLHAPVIERRTPRVRKTRDTWQLHVNYGHGDGYEHEVTEFTFREIRDRRREYRINCPEYATKIVFKREKI